MHTRNATPKKQAYIYLLRTTPFWSDQHNDCCLALTFQVVEGVDNGEGLLSTVTWVISPNEMHFLVLKGYGDICGKCDLLISAQTHDPLPLSPSPPPAQPDAPPVPPACAADRATAPNQGRRSICNVFNDPHVITFSDQYQTCNMTGQVEFLVNDHIVIFAHVVPLQVQSSSIVSQT